jgi:hypothetical protein
MMINIEINSRGTTFSTNKQLIPYAVVIAMIGRAVGELNVTLTQTQTAAESTGLNIIPTWLSI